MKRYLREEHSEAVLKIMEADRVWAASELAAAEAHVTLCARLDAPTLRDETRRRLDLDWTHFTVVVVGDELIARAVEIACQMGTRTLDSIHLAAAQRLPAGITFVTFDERQAAAARALGFAVAP